MDAYQVLGLARGASEEEVKGAYRTLAQKYNPENYEAGPLRQDAEQKMEELNQAFDSIMSELRGVAVAQPAQPEGEAGHVPPFAAENEADLPQIRQLVQSGRVDEALARLQAYPNGAANAEWNFLMGSAYYYKGWLTEALRYFQEACRLAPSNREYAAALHNLQSSAGGQMPGNPYGNAYPGGARANAMGCSCCDMCTAMVCMDMCCGCGNGC